jgi:hypothetical protein
MIVIESKKEEMRMRAAKEGRRKGCKMRWIDRKSEGTY